MASGDILTASDIGLAATAWTPALTGTTTNPTLGSGGNFTQSGFYYRVGKLVYASATLRFGTAGVSAGSGDYRISLPVAASASLAAAGTLGGAAIIGSGIVRDNSAVSASRAVAVQLVSSTTVLMVAGSGDSINSAAPWAWAASDAITIGVVYPID